MIFLLQKIFSDKTNVTLIFMYSERKFVCHISLFCIDFANPLVKFGFIFWVLHSYMLKKLYINIVTVKNPKLVNSDLYI